MEKTPLPKSKHPGEREIAWLRTRSREWNAAWNELAAVSGDEDKTAEHPRSGECWQYMGSWFVGRRWQHTFRHRQHPQTGDRLYLHLFATRGWKPEHEQRKRPKRRTLH
jgi:hypothetical protein